jgi:hypothetical protein
MQPETFRAYFDAYVSEATGVTSTNRRNAKRRGRRGITRQVRNYLVNVTHRFTREEFDDIYPREGLQ